MTGTLIALAGAYGVYLLYTALALRWKGLGVGPPSTKAQRRGATEWLVQAGLDDVSPAEFAAVTVTLGALGGAVAYALFGAILPVVVCATFAGSFPVGWYRGRRQKLRAEARDSWPRLIEEVRLQTGSLGRSVPQALVEVGRRAPEPLRTAFAAAEREWNLTTDVERMFAVLKARLADATADAACETLLVAHQLGGTDVDRRLEALIEDRVQDLQGRKDAAAKQAGVRFARRFVLLVPLGMSVAGLSIGTGREAYQRPLGQVAVAFGISCVVACWVWAGRLLQLPEEERVFTR